MTLSYFVNERHPSFDIHFTILSFGSETMNARKCLLWLNVLIPSPTPTITYTEYGKGAQHNICEGGNSEADENTIC